MTRDACVQLRHDVAGLGARLTAGEVVTAEEVARVSGWATVGQIGGEARVELVELVAAVAEQGRDDPAGLSIEQRLTLVTIVRKVAPPALGGDSTNIDVSGDTEAERQIERAHLMALISFVVAAVVVPVDGLRQLEAIPGQWSKITAIAARAAMFAAVEGWQSAGGPPSRRIRSTINLSGHVLVASDDAADLRQWKVRRSPIRPGRLLPPIQDFPRIMLTDVGRWLGGRDGLALAGPAVVLHGLESPRRGRGLMTSFRLRATRATREYRSNMATLVSIPVVLAIVFGLMWASGDVFGRFKQPISEAVKGLAGYWESLGALSVGLLGVMATIGIAAAVLARGTNRPAPEVVSLARLTAMTTFTIAGLVTAVVGFTVTALAVRGWQALSAQDVLVAVLLVVIVPVSWMTAALVSQVGVVQATDLRDRQRVRRVRDRERALKVRPLAKRSVRSRSQQGTRARAGARTVSQRVASLPAWARLALLGFPPLGVVVTATAMLRAGLAMTEEQAVALYANTLAVVIVNLVITGLTMLMAWMAADATVMSGGAVGHRLLSVCLVVLLSVSVWLMRIQTVSEPAMRGGPDGEIYAITIATGELVLVTAFLTWLVCYIPTAMWHYVLRAWNLRLRQL